MMVLWYLLGFVCGVFFHYALSLIVNAKRKAKSTESDDALKNILNY